MLAALVVVRMGLLGVSPEIDCTPLQSAVLLDQAPVVRRLAGRRLLGFIAPEADLEKRGPYSKCKQMTPLMLAAESGNLEAAKTLISSGADVSASEQLPEYGDILIDARCLAVANNHPDLVALLDRNQAREGSCTEIAELFRLAALDDVEGLTRQLAVGPPLLSTEAILRAMVGRRVNRVTDLLIQRAMLEKLDFTRLYEHAILLDDVAFVRKLSDGGARVVRTRAIALAIAGAHTEMFGPLITAGAKVEEAKEAILRSLEARDPTTIRALIKHNYRGDAETPLLVTAIDAMPEVVEELIRAGVSVNVDDSEGRTPLMAAAARRQPGLVKLLLEHGASKRTADLECVTAAAYALRATELELAAMLQSNESAVPGPAAQDHGITCGNAKVLFRVAPTDRIRLKAPGAGFHLPLRNDKVAYLNPGLVEVELMDMKTNVVQQRTLLMERGMNTFDRRDFGLFTTTVFGNEAYEQRAIQALFEGKRPDVEPCIAEQNRRAPRAHGTMALELEVQTSGKVSMRLPKDEGPATLFNCLSTVAQRWSFNGRMFPSTPVKVSVTY